MKKINSLNNSQGVISLFIGLKSRISPTRPLLTMLALLMVCLFGVNENAWGGNVSTTTAKLELCGSSRSTHSVKKNEVTFAIGGNNNTGVGVADYNYVKSGKEVSLTWSGVPSGYTINVTKVTLDARRYGVSSSGSGQYKTSKNGSYTSFCSSNSWSNRTLNSTSYFPLGNSGSIYIKGDGREIDYKNIEFTYTIGNNYNIAFNANGGSGSMSNVSMVYYISKNLPANTFTRAYTVSYDVNKGTLDAALTSANTASNYTFGGWATSANGSKVYDDKASVSNLTETVNGTYNLFAIWNDGAVTLPSATKEGCVLLGWYNGDVKVGEAGDPYYPTASVELKAKWGDKHTPVMTGSDQLMMVDGELENAFTFEHVDGQVAHITIKSISDVRNGNQVISYENNKIIAHNAGVAEIYFTQAETETIKKDTSATYTYTVYKYNSTFANVVDKSVNVDANVASSYTLTYVKPNAAYIEKAAPSAAGTPALGESNSFYYTLTQNVTTAITTGSPDGSLAISYNASTKTATGKNAGTGTIHLYQPETYKYNAADTSFVVTVSKHEPTFEWNKNNTAYYHNTSIANIFSTTNKDCNYTITSSDALVATVSNNTLYILAKTSPSKATFTVTQDENYYWKGKTSYYDVTPTNPSNHLTMNYSQTLYDDGSITSKTGTTQWEKDYVIIGDALGGGFNWNDKYIIIHFTGIPDKLSFNYRASTDDVSSSNGLKTGAWAVKESANGTNWSNALWTSTSNTETFTGSGNIQLATSSRYVMLLYAGNFAGYFQNIKITELKKFEPSVDALDFETQQIKVACPSKTFELDYANIGHNVTLSVNDDAFTVSPTTITSIGGEKSGTYTPITVSYSTENVHKSAADAKITIQDELGNKKYVYLSGETKKKKQTLNWIDKYNVGQPSIPVNKEITGAATCSPLTDVRYSSSDPTVIEILDDGRSFRALIADSAATITARQAGDAEWDTISITKRFKTTNKTVQVILWNQNLTNFTTENTSSALQAKVYLEDPKTGTLTYSAERTLLLTYTPGNESVVTVDGTTLHIQGKGTTTLTASIEGDEDYEGTSAVLPVAVNEPIAGCPDVNLPVSIIGDDMVENGEIILFNISTDKPTLSKTISINTEKGLPGELHFSTKGTKFAKIWFSGEIEVRESSDNVHWSGVKWHKTPSVSDNYSQESIVLQHDTRYIQFTRPQGGEGYHQINNIYVTPAQFIETNLPKDKLSKDSLGFGIMEFSSSLEKVVEISYANAKSNLTLAVDDANKDNISLSANTIDISECGAKGTYNLTVTCTPQSATPINATITVTDINAGKSKTIRVVADVIRAAQHIEWTPTKTSFYTIQAEELNEQLPLLTDKDQTVILTSKNASIVSFTGTTASIHKDGTVTLCASHPGTPDLNKVDTIKHDFTFNITPTTIDELPTTGTIYGGTAANAVVLTGGSAKNTVNNGIVGGTFKVISPETLNAGIYNVTIEFIPNNENIYSRSQATLENVNVCQITPDESVLGVTVGDITYGQRIDEASLSNTGSLAGTWYWVDEAANHVTPVADTHNGLNVYFVPTNTNYATVYSTVSLTVNKATPTLIWTSNPTELAYNATDAVYTAESNSNEGAISYSIETGSTYAEIDENTGVLTILEPGHDITVKATQAVSTNYKEESIKVDVTIASAPVVNEFTNAAGDGDWSNDSNWSSGSKPDGTENPDVIVSGKLIIDEDVTVGNLTIEPEGGVTVVTNGTLTINGSSNDQSGYGDLYVKNGGEVNVVGSLKVGDLAVEASIGTSIGNAQSGQVAKAEHIVYTNAYIDINMDPNGVMDDTKWYGFTVPFAVDAHNGVSRLEGTTYRKCVYGTDYMIAEYDADKRLNSGNGWKFITGNTLNAGQFYFLTVDGSYNTYRFKASGNTYALAADASLSVNGDVTNYNANWNGVGNSTLQHVTASYTGGEYVQVYMNGKDAYKTVSTNDATFVVGCPFFIQAKEATTLSLDVQNSSTEKYYAPRHIQGKATGVAQISLSATDGGYSDQIYFRAVDKDEDAYIIGQDLSKAGESKVVPQLWMAQYNQKLSVHEAAWNGNRAACSLGIYTPKAGSYELAIDAAPEDATLYLTYNGRAIWNLSMSAYEFDLDKGTTEGYGLRIVASEQTTTDIEQSEISDQSSVRKVMIDDMIYIVTPEGKMYDIVGKGIKF